MLRTILLGLTLIAVSTATASGQIRAQIPANVGPDWDKGIQPIGQDNYYKAIECGKAGGENPGCLFYDAGLCKNDDFVLALYTPYKYVALQVWNAVRQKK